LLSTTRRIFEQTNTVDFLTIDNLQLFIIDRVEELENAGTSTAPTVKSQSKSQTKTLASKAKHNKNKTAASSWKPFRSSHSLPVALEANKPSAECHKCEQYCGGHSLASSSKFKKLSIDDRYVLVSSHRLCMVYFASNHWANKCKASCSNCHGRHNQLLHRDNSHSKATSSKQPAVSLVSTQCSRSVLLGTTSVKVRDMAGCLQVL